MSDRINENLRNQAIPNPEPTQTPKTFENQARSFDSIKSGRRRRLAAVALGAAAAVWAGHGLYEMNQPHVPEPNKIELATITIEPNAVLRTQARIETKTDAEQGKNDSTISRENLTLDGHSLTNEPFSILNALAVEFPGGDTYLIIKNVKDGDKQLDLAVAVHDPGVKHSDLQGFVDILPDGTVKNNKGEVIPPDQIEQYSFPNENTKP